ncbi:MAG: binding-protein-dependent transport system inner rane component [Thermoleophilia bacterium]|nr:binding-protein-dependent transport system inner rane component [Thermoleophilia bacterium]
MSFVLDNKLELVRLLLEHVLLSAVSLGIAIVLAVPLGVWMHGRSRRIGVVTAIAGVMYTVPSLALFSILVPLVGLGMVPTVIGLVLYAQLMLVRAVVGGLDSVPEDVRDAAVGMGIDRWTILTTVDLPLALPVFLAGVRMAAVTVIGIATIGAVIDAGGLGELILQGIQRDQTERVVVGALLVTALALAADYGLVRLERMARPWANAPRGAAPAAAAAGGH